jgi:hypothetical protein
MSYTFELNNEIKDANFASGKINASSVVVEIFSAMANGKDLSSYGKKADVAAKYITELNQKASMGDVSAKSELNTIRRFAMEPVLMQEIKLLGIFGNYKNIGYDESPEIEIPVYANVDAKIQAAGQDVKFPVIRKERKSVTTTTISGGHAVDYRKAALGNMQEENELMEQVRINIRNKAAKYVFDTVYNAIKNATGVKYFAEDAGLTKTNLDKVITNVRRWGKPTIVGDYALVSQINAFAGYQGTTPAVNGISEKVMSEIQSTGLLGMYNGAVISEMPNPYDLTTLKGEGDDLNFATLLDPSVGFVLPAGVQSPIYTITRGGLTSCHGLDITTGMEMTRFDLEVGALVTPREEYKIGVIADTNL